MLSYVARTSPSKGTLLTPLDLDSELPLRALSACTYSMPVEYMLICRSTQNIAPLLCRGRHYCPCPHNAMLDALTLLCFALSGRLSVGTAVAVHSHFALCCGVPKATCHQRIGILSQTPLGRVRATTKTPHRRIPRMSPSLPMRNTSRPKPWRSWGNRAEAAAAAVESLAMARVSARPLTIQHHGWAIMVSSFGFWPPTRGRTTSALW